MAWSVLLARHWPELVLTVWPRSSEELGGDREDVADALQVFGWHLLPISDSGADRL